MYFEQVIHTVVQITLQYFEQGIVRSSKTSQEK